MSNIILNSNTSKSSFEPSQANHFVLQAPFIVDKLSFSSECFLELKINKYKFKLFKPNIVETFVNSNCFLELS